jgi:hypothetical protein
VVVVVYNFLVAATPHWGQYRLTKHNHRLHEGFRQRRRPAMFGAFFLPFQYFPFDDSWIDSVAPHLIIRSFTLKLRQQTYDCEGIDLTLRQESE